jgi:prepilin-type N-terminal cleavage/methylation domain-containing protein
LSLCLCGDPDVKRLSRSGFSLIELVIVIGLVSILGAIAYPSFASYSAPFRVQSAGREVYGALQDVRQQAIARGCRTRFQVVGTDGYTLEWEDDGVWRTIRGPLRLEPGVQLASSAGDMVFQPRGTVSPLSTITVSDVEHPEHSLSLTVPITGLVRIRAGGA